MFEDGLDQYDLERVYFGLSEIVNKIDNTGAEVTDRVFGQDPDVMFDVPYACIAQLGIHIEDKELLADAIAVGEQFIKETRQEGLTLTCSEFEKAFKDFLAVQNVTPVDA